MLAGTGRYGELEARTRELLSRHPDSGLLWKILGVAQWHLGKDSLLCMQRAVELLPDDAEAHGNLGNTLRACGQLEAAVLSHRRALRLKPTYAESHNNLGSVLQDLGRLQEAEASFRRATELNPDFALAHGNLGNVLALLDRVDESEASCRRALELDPSLTAALVQLAEVHAGRGQFDKTEELLKRALSMEPNMPEAWAALVRSRKMSVADAGWLAAARSIAGQRLPARREVHLRYALGKYFDDVGEYTQAFHEYRRANELSKQGRPPHDRAQFQQGVDRLIQTFDRDWLDRVRTAGNPSERPVFIVGTPRSGTTLTEQILAAHPAVFGAGELPFWNAAAATFAAARGEATDLDVLRRLAAQYLASLDRVSPGKLRVVDKMPANYLYLVLIHAALPNARIIHMRRHPIDTCLSIYFQNFDAKHSYANDLDDLAHYYREYLRIMDQWRRVIPAHALLEVPYESLVEDAEGWSRKMLEFIGMPWDPNCLAFHLNERTVNTASKWQARQKISRSSVGRWRQYAAFLGPLGTLIEDPQALPMTI